MAAAGVDNRPFKDAELLGAYQFLKNDKVGPRNISKYVLRDDRDQTYATAVTSIDQFLKNNPNLIPTFSTVPNELRDYIDERPCLTVNGLAVCISKENSPLSSLEHIANEHIPNIYKDIFSGSFVEEPVKCTKGHTLEKNYTEFWLKKSNLCPAGQHLIGDLEVDDEFQIEVEEFVRKCQKKDAANKKLKDMIKFQDTELSLKNFAILRRELKLDIQETMLLLETTHQTYVDAITTKQKIKPSKQLITFAGETLSLAVKTVGKVALKPILVAGGKFTAKVINMSQGLGLLLAGFSLFIEWEKENHLELVQN